MGNDILFELDDRIIKLLGYDSRHPIQDLKDAIVNLIEDRCEGSFQRAKREWFQKFVDDPSILSIPFDKWEFLDMVLEHPDYKK